MSQLLLTAFCGFLAGSLLEYWVHRLMHAGLFLARRHALHHESGEAKGVIPEFLDYVLGAAVVLPWGFFWSPFAGAGWPAGVIAYGFVSAFGHQVQHDAPGRCFWMRRMPVHYVHHRYGMTRHNFGLAVPWWDHVFGTWREVPWEPPARAPQDVGLFGIRWTRRAPSARVS